MNNFHRDFENDQKSFNIMFNIISFMAAFIFIMVIGLFIFKGYVVYKAIENPAIVGETVGKIVNGFNKELNK